MQELWSTTTTLVHNTRTEPKVILFCALMKSLPNKYATVTYNTVCNINAGNYIGGPAGHRKNETRKDSFGNPETVTVTLISKFPGNAFKSSGDEKLRRI